MQSLRSIVVVAVQVAVILHAGANLELEVGILTYHVTEKQDTVPIVVCGVLALISITIIIGKIHDVMAYRKDGFS